MAHHYKYDATKYMEANDRLTNMTEMERCMEKAEERGFIDQFRATSNGLKHVGTEKLYHPNEVRINNFYRFEGISDPDDMSILYEIETADGKKGTLVDAFGLYSDPKISEFMKDVEDINKKVTKSDKPPHP